LREEITWSPEEERTNLFEPVALAEFGPLLAVADRGNGIISVLDTYTLKVRDQFALDRPRDLIVGGIRGSSISFWKMVLFTFASLSARKTPRRRCLWMG
jgi:hypothetical protein